MCLKEIWRMGFLILYTILWEIECESDWSMIIGHICQCLSPVSTTFIERYWLVYALCSRWLPIFMEIFLKSFEVCAIDLWIQLTLFRVPSLSATGNGMMIRVLELFYLMGDLSNNLTKVLVVYVLLFITDTWYGIN